MDSERSSDWASNSLFSFSLSDEAVARASSSAAMSSSRPATASLRLAEDAVDSLMKASLVEMVRLAALIACSFSALFVWHQHWDLSNAVRSASASASTCVFISAIRSMTFWTTPSPAFFAFGFAAVPFSSRAGAGAGAPATPTSRPDGGGAESSRAATAGAGAGAAARTKSSELRPKAAAVREWPRLGSRAASSKLPGLVILLAARVSSSHPSCLL
mmetsp:Transcript_49268/g.104838  ORF Transcript_49268/g.104838 Transcript_49268/m.104838 type:complete len:216 (+) Transcript_49268:1714-2361(+)